MTIKSITPFLWFDRCAEEAANFYVSLFPNSKITHVSRYGDTGAWPQGQRDGGGVRTDAASASTR